MNDLIRDLELLLLAHHALILLETDDDDRAHRLLAGVARRRRIPHYVWRVHKGLCLDGNTEAVVERTIAPHHCLEHILTRREPGVFEMQALAPFLEMPVTVELLKDVHARFSKHAGALFFTGDQVNLPPELEQRVTRVDVAPPSRDERWRYVLGVLKELGGRFDFEVDMQKDEAQRLVDLLAGMTFFEITKLLSRCVVETRRFDETTLEAVRAAKASMLSATGVVEYVATPHSMKHVAGMAALKSWLGKRAALFSDLKAAASFGLAPPKGLLLLGVPGCGKSLCAKAVASEWKLPLLRLDAGSIFGKFLGESEANLRRAFEVAEAMAPTVLWIDEVEKAFGGGDAENATTRRVFGAFLQWMQDKKGTVFVVATANDVSQLPPELLRKGRFDEIFFVDLPTEEVRREIFAVHLGLRKRNAAEFDLVELGRQSEGFSGAEIEQAVISGLYTAFSLKQPLSTDHLLSELDQTQPLSVTMAERIAALRIWAAARTIPAD